MQTLNVNGICPNWDLDIRERRQSKPACSLDARYERNEKSIQSLTEIR